MEFKVYRKGKEYSVYIDKEDEYLFEKHRWIVWSSPRHNSSYLVTSRFDKEKALRIHRVIMNAKPGEIVDHINGNALDNRRCNLRITTQRGNNKNAAKRKDAMTSKYKGVRQPRGSKKWTVQLQADYKTILGGTFKTEVEAALKYNELALLHFGEYAKLNIIEEVPLIAEPAIAST